MSFVQLVRQALDVVRPSTYQERCEVAQLRYPGDSTRPVYPEQMTPRQRRLLAVWEREHPRPSPGVRDWHRCPEESWE